MSLLQSSRHVESEQLSVQFTLSSSHPIWHFSSRSWSLKIVLRIDPKISNLTYGQPKGTLLSMKSPFTVVNKNSNTNNIYLILVLVVNNSDVWRAKHLSFSQLDFEINIGSDGMINNHFLIRVEAKKTLGFFTKVFCCDCTHTYMAQERKVRNIFLNSKHFSKFE